MAFCLRCFTFACIMYFIKKKKKTYKDHYPSQVLQIVVSFKTWLRKLRNSLEVKIYFIVCVNTNSSRHDVFTIQINTKNKMLGRTQMKVGDLTEVDIL